MLSSRLISKRLLQSTTRYASTLIVAEPLLDGAIVSPATQSAVTAAQELGGDDLSLLVVDGAVPTQVPDGVSKVYHVPIGDKLTESVATAVQHLCTAHSWGHVVTPSSKFGSTFLPRAAALLNVSPVTDVIEIVESGMSIYILLGGLEECCSSRDGQVTLVECRLSLVSYRRHCSVCRSLSLSVCVVVAVALSVYGPSSLFPHSYKRFLTLTTTFFCLSLHYTTYRYIRPSHVCRQRIGKSPSNR